jgi:DivIVA domain-containing protein
VHLELPRPASPPRASGERQLVTWISVRHAQIMPPGAGRLLHPTRMGQAAPMALTPEDVDSKRFHTVRFKRGYVLTEVDDFLDEVVAELSRLNQRIADLEHH